MSWQQAFRNMLSPATAARLEADLGHPIVPVVICAWCPDFDPDAASNAGASHGACPACLAKLNAEMDAEDARRVTA